MVHRTPLNKRKKAYDREGDMKAKWFYLFLIAQLCALFGLVVGVVFFIVRLLKMCS